MPPAPLANGLRRGGTLTAVTLNTWKGDGAYRLRLAAMADMLRAQQPDIVLLQECLRSADGQFDTASELARALGMRSHWTPARFKSRQIEGQSCLCWSGMAVLTHGDIVRHAALDLPSNAADGDRVAQTVHIRLHGRMVQATNVHLTHLPHAQALRQAQLDQALAAATGPLAADVHLLGGDFNTPLDALPDLRHHAAWQPVCTTARLLHKTTHVDEAGLPHDLDHWLGHTGDAVHWLRAWVAGDVPEASGVLPSDHRAVCIRGNWA